MSWINYVKTVFALVCTIAITSCGLTTARFKGCSTQEEFCRMLDIEISDHLALKNLFPKTVDEIRQRSVWIIDKTKRMLDDLYAIKDADRTFENTILYFDLISSKFSSVLQVLHLLEMVSPDDEIRIAAQEAVIKLDEFSVDAFSNKRVYAVFKDYVDKKMDKEDLSTEALYTIEESMKSFIRQGFNLPDDEYQEVLKVKKEISKLSIKFDSNIALDKSFISVSGDQLKGVDQHLLDQLEKDDQGNYKLGCDYPTRFEIMGNCHDEEVRKRFNRMYNSRAYPQNYDLLKEIMKKRYDLAKMLGFESFASLDLASGMIKTTEKASAFLEQLIEKCRPKVDQEVGDLIKDLPANISLINGKFNSWDVAYAKECYKKKHLNIDERKIAEYFSVEKTVKGIFDIYQRFLGLDFKLIKPDWSWNNDVDVIEIYDKNLRMLLGFIYLDLYPRKNKYSHACHSTMVATTKSLDSKTGRIRIKPSVSAVIANFPKPGKNGRPALLKFSDVETFFHEFGHAMHALLGSTELECNSGTSVKTDFVEAPSQMFENWLYEKDILQGLSSHYQTVEQLPTDMVEKLVALKKFDSGRFVVGQCFYSRISLDLFDSNYDKDIDSFVENIERRYFKHVNYDPENRFCASFGHLTGYGAKYYSYMWSKVSAIDLFYEVKKLGGIDSTEAGKLFINKVLGKGGSVDPEVLLKDFLGREPNDDAFIKDLGIF